MPKNIALFIDGTEKNGRLEKGGKSNVWRLYEAASARDGPSTHDAPIKVAALGSLQVCQYINGIATDDEAGDREWGKALTGFGAESRLRKGYRFLAENYDDGDNVFLFGFSRGAFVARSLASFVGLVGVLFKEIARDESPRRDMLAEAYHLYVKGISGERSFIASILHQLQGIDGERRFNENNIPTIDIHFIGVWDTVRMLGAEALPLDVTRRWTRHHDHPSLAPHISHARHALAIHETRPEFEPTLWEDWNDQRDKKKKAQTLEQVWFPGDHTDIGGGHDDHDDEHGDVTLEWMAIEARDKGLLLDESGLPMAKPRAQSGAVHHLVAARAVHARKRLKTWSAPSHARLLDSFRMHEAVAEHFLRATPTRFIPRDPEPWEWIRLWPDPPDDELLADVDSAAFQLHAALACVHGRRLAGSTATIDLACDADDWWTPLSLEDARGCSAAVVDFLADAENADVTLMTPALRTFLLCGMGARVQKNLTDTTASVVAELTTDPCAVRCRERAANWRRRLKALCALTAGGMKSEIGRLDAEVRYEAYRAQGKCHKTKGGGVLKPRREDGA